MADESVTTSSEKRVAIGRSRLVPTLVVMGLMLVEGMGVYFVAKTISPGPAGALALQAGGGGGVSGNASVPISANSLGEVELADCRPINKMSGKFLTFQIRVTALVDANDLEGATETARKKRARIEDGVNNVIRAAEPAHLNEPKLDTLRKRLKHELDRVFGDDQIIKDILIPQFIQSGPGV